MTAIGLMPPAARQAEGTPGPGQGQQSEHRQSTHEILLKIVRTNYRDHNDQDEQAPQRNYENRSVAATIF